MTTTTTTTTNNNNNNTNTIITTTTAAAATTSTITTPNWNVIESRQSSHVCLMVSILLCVVLNAAWPTLPNQSAPLISRSHNPNVHTAMKPKGPSMWQGLLLGNGPVSSRGCQRKRDGGPALERQVSQLPPASSCCCACLLPHILSNSL